MCGSVSGHLLLMYAPSGLVVLMTVTLNTNLNAIGSTVPTVICQSLTTSTSTELQTLLVLGVKATDLWSETENVRSTPTTSAMLMFSDLEIAPGIFLIIQLKVNSFGLSETNSRSSGTISKLMKRDG